MCIPACFRLYEENNFSKYARAANRQTKDDSEDSNGLTPSEKVLLRILKKVNSVRV